MLRELYESEKTYVYNLETILRTFLPALAHTMPHEELQVLIPIQLEVLLDRHKAVLIQMSEQITSPEGVIGNIFSTLCSRSKSDIIDIYCAYFNNFTAAMETLVKYERSLAFCQAFQLCQPQCKGLSLAAYLLTPVQRLPRYELLLKEILKYTAKSHADFRPLETAIQQLRMQLLRVNNSIRSCQMSCLMGRDDRRASRRSISRSHHFTQDISRCSSQAILTAKKRSHKRALSQDALDFSLGVSDSNVEDGHIPADNLIISCSDLTLDFKETSPSSTDHSRDTCELSSPSQPKIIISSPIHFRHVKHGIM